jgi:hypothetical protein
MLATVVCDRKFDCFPNRYLSAHFDSSPVERQHAFDVVDAIRPIAYGRPIGAIAVDVVLPETVIVADAPCRERSAGVQLPVALSKSEQSLRGRRDTPRLSSAH